MHDRDTGAVATVNQRRLHLTGLKQYQFNYNLYFMFLCTRTNKMDVNNKKGWNTYIQTYIEIWLESVMCRK